VDGLRVLVLSYVQPEGFWSTTDFGRSYHILQPLPGLFALAGAFLVLLGVLALTRKKEEKAEFL